MGAQPHLYVAVTAHGYGHATQVGVVVRALRTRLPSLRVTVQSLLGPELLDTVMGGPVERVPIAADVGMVMASALDVRVGESADAYAAFHRDWPTRIADAAAGLASLRPDLLLAGVPYLPIAAARRAGVPALALCSLNWADLYRHYCAGRPESARIHGEILDAYEAAESFLVAEPGMPMTSLSNARRIGPCAAIGRQRRDELDRRLGLRPGDRAVLVAMGGVPLATDCYARWPTTPGLHWVVQADRLPARPDMTPLSAIDMPVIDLLCSSDALVSKLGYGFPTECACNGVPLLFLPRPDWPESVYIGPWVEHHGRAASINRAEFEQGGFVDRLDAVTAAPKPPPPPPSGIEEAVSNLLRHLA